MPLTTKEPAQCQPECDEQDNHHDLCLPSASSKSNENELQPMFLKSVESDHNLSKYRINCHIESVWHEWEMVEDSSHHNQLLVYGQAAVLLDIGFDLTGEELKSIAFNINILGNASNSLRLDVYPDAHEHYNTYLHTSNGIQAGYLIFSAFRISNEIRLQFITKNSPYIPPSIKVLLVVSNYKNAPSSGFPFTLQILPAKLHIYVNKPWWHLGWKTRLQPKKSHHGWSYDIKANYCPDMARNIFLEYEKLTYRFGGGFKTSGTSKSNGFYKFTKLDMVKISMAGGRCSRLSKVKRQADESCQGI